MKTFGVWNVEFARFSATQLPRRLATALADRLEDKYHRPYVVMPTV
jgi:hypothetical protein